MKPRRTAQGAKKKQSISGQQQQREKEAGEAETGAGASNISCSQIHYLLDQRKRMSKEQFLERPFAEKAAWYMHNWALITMASDAIAVLKLAKTDPIGDEITSLYHVFLNSVEVSGYRRAEQSWVRALGLFYKKAWNGGVGRPLRVQDRQESERASVSIRGTGTVRLAGRRWILTLMMTMASVPASWYSRHSLC